MQNNPKNIKKHFEKSLDKYADNAYVQKICADIIIRHLMEFVSSEDLKILEVGTGSGILSRKISENLKYKLYHANDIVEKSMLYIKKYVPQVKFFSGDFRKIRFPQKYDLILANAVFQWFDNLEKVFDKCSNLLEKDGILAFSTFSKENLKEFSDITNLKLNYKNTDELKEILSGQFELIWEYEFEHTINFNNPLEILLHLKNTGVNSLSEKVWGIRDVKEFCQKYNSKYPQTKLTYSPIIIFAKKLS